MEDNMTEVDYSSSSPRRIARQIIDLNDMKRKAILRSFTSDVKYRVVEEMVNIRLDRLRDPDGMIRPGKVSER